MSESVENGPEIHLPGFYCIPRPYQTHLQVVSSFCWVLFLPREAHTELDLRLTEQYVIHQFRHCVEAFEKRRKTEAEAGVATQYNIIRLVCRLEV